MKCEAQLERHSLSSNEDTVIFLQKATRCAYINS
jgi:hypothetical protein